MNPSPEDVLTIKDFMPLLGVVIGGALATIGGFASNYFVETRREASDSKKLAYAFKGELQALSAIAEKRGYIKHIKTMITVMEQTKKPLFVHIHIRREYFNVFNNNVSKIGSLKNPLPEKIAMYYVQANSILEDIQSYREGVYNEASVESVIGSKKELVVLMEDTFSLGDEIAGIIDEKYS